MVLQTFHELIFWFIFWWRHDVGD